MDEHFSKSKLATGISALRANLPIIVLSPKAGSGKNNVTFLNKQRTMGFWIVFLILCIVTVSIISKYHNQRAFTQTLLISDLPILHLQLAKNIQKTPQAHSITFTHLLDYKNKINTLINIMSEGGNYQGETVVAVTDPATLATLEVYRRDWQQIDEQINLLLNYQDAIIKLNSSIKTIETLYSQLTRRIDETLYRMLEIGNLPHEMRIMETIRARARNATQNIQVIFLNELSFAEIAAQLNQDQAQITAITQTISQGSQGLGAISDKDEMIQDLLSHIYSLLRKFDQHINLVQKEIAAAMTVQSTIQKISSKSDEVITSIEEIKNKAREHNFAFISILDTLFYFLAAILTLCLISFIYHVRQNLQDKASQNKDEIKHTQLAIRKLLSDMKRIAEGDLTVRTDITNDTTGAIADAINCTIEELHTLVEQVNQAGALVVKSSNQAQYVSTELLSAAQHQSAKIEETTLAVLGMAESISEVSNLATESAKVAEQSLTTAERGTKAVRDSIAGMNEIRAHIQDTSKRIKRLGESSQEIGEIIALISDITDQTNVLALNAALQANVAGEAGRGFSVIAQEVQRLAERSTEASKQIGELIITIQGDTQDAIAAMERSTLGVAQGAQRSDAAGRALEEIEQVSKQLAKQVTHIFDVTNMQTRAAHQVVANMEEILRITRKNTEGTQKTTTSIKQIAGFASELKASVSNFKV
ncbi:twitching motility protein PilJ [Nitrosomonas sp. PY1]|uniref:methyl-accepting chemotaxis protein n=1 Tax=Nitrosomonas sp. PY1 TaxID=1803906 RepID=UPI001FC8428C|nr:methyl-accepting chemotaxis protein [Nitrosomonas sp. PY1]GKS68325.1 twitching motility protein PilJ [Nitrosomonas sp. PY1]